MRAMEPVRVDILGPEPPRPSRHRGRLVLVALGFLLLAAGLWARGFAGFVAWQVARDHQRCFGRRQLAARLWTSDPWEARLWLEERGTPVAPLPEEAGTVRIVGVRYCPLTDRIAGHVYYGGAGSVVSVFVLAGPARVGMGWSGEASGLQVRLIPSAGRTLAVVGESEGDVDAVAQAFRASLARLTPPTRLDSLFCLTSVGL
jgi:hypothetical protein